MEHNKENEEEEYSDIVKQAIEDMQKESKKIIEHKDRMAKREAYGFLLLFATIIYIFGGIIFDRSISAAEGIIGLILTLISLRMLNVL